MKKVIIIGSGMGGLMAGNLLARKGHKVTIFESHSSPGGYTAGFRRNGFYFESGTLSFEASGLVFKAMKDLGLFEKIRFERQIFRFVTPELDMVLDSYPEYKNSIYKVFPQEKEALDGYFKEVDKMYRAMSVLMADKRPLLSRLVPFAGAALAMAGLYGKYKNVTITDFTARFFKPGSRLFNLFKSFGYPDMSAHILGGALATIFDDYWTIGTGMQSWADLLAGNFKKLGGELALNSYADRIITKNKAACGVSVKGVIREAGVVISAGDYKKTFLQWLDDPSLIPPELSDRIRNTSVSEGVCTVYLGLNMENKKLQSIMHYPHVIYFNEADAADIKDANDRAYFTKASVNLYSPSLYDEKLSPPGKSSLMIQALVPFHWMDNWHYQDKDAYRKLKEEAKTAMIRQAAHIIPDLEKLIELSDIATPLTYERYTHNTDGATSAFSWNPHKKFYKSPMKTYVDTPVKNLYIGSCWSSQIGGIPGAISAAYACAKRI